MSKNPLTPAIRFSGFTDAWERRQLGECFAERVESMPSGELISVTINDGIKKFSELGRHDSSNDDKTKYKKVCVGDIAYNSMRMWQGASGYSPYEGIVSPAYTVLSPNVGIDAKCFSYLFKRSNVIHTFKINSQGITSDNWNLKYPTLSEISVNISKELEEQQKIASQLSTLDRLIIHQQKKYEKLVNLKKAMLDKMFPKNGELVPEVRFAGFSGNWKRRKLGEIVNRVVRKNTDNASSLALTISAQHGLVDQGNYFNNRVASQDVSNYYLIRKGEFAYNKSSSDGSPFGVVKRLDLYDMGVLSTLYIVFDIKDPNSVNTDYLSVFFDTNRWHKEVSTRASEGARNHGLLNISATDFLDIEINVPREYDEQEKLGEFFMKLAHLIDRYEQGLMSLRNLKSAFLDKMFV